MENYDFQITPYNTESLLWQVSTALEKRIVVSFSETGMEIQADGKDFQHIPYNDFECMIETIDLFLFVFDTRITVLQKKDLTSKATNDFRDFISEKPGKTVEKI